MPRYELAELANNAPSIADAIARLYGALKEAHREGGVAAGGDARAVLTPEKLGARSHPTASQPLPQAGGSRRTLGGALRDPLSMAEPMRRRLRDAWGISAKVVPQGDLGNLSQLYDKERRQFPAVEPVEGGEPHVRPSLSTSIDGIRQSARPDGVRCRPPDEGISQLLHMHLANYAAGAIMMPYGRFLAACEDTQYSIGPTQRRIRRERRTDRASLHYSQPSGTAGRSFLHASGRSGRKYLEALRRRSIPFSRFGGTCPRWKPARSLPGRGAGGHPVNRDAGRDTVISPSLGRSSGRSGPNWAPDCLRSAGLRH